MTEAFKKEDAHKAVRNTKENNECIFKKCVVQPADIARIFVTNFISPNVKKNALIRL